LVPREAESEFTWVAAADDAELVRWYLEDYAEFPADPAPKVAQRAEARLADLGSELFARVFGAGDAAQLWYEGTSGVGGLAGTRVEVDADPGDVPGLPWELLRQPSTGAAAVLGAGEFVRTHLQAARQAVLPQPAGDRLRVLLVICRPGGGEDVPFRSVASRLVRGGGQAVEGLDLDVLRPATFARLAQVLRAAAAAGRPYHVVHFDGHGAFVDVTKLADDPADEADGEAGGGGLPVSPVAYRPSVAGPVRSGRHGYLLFEAPGAPSNQQLVDGPTLGALLAETGVPVLVLNACRSAWAEAPQAPVADGQPADGDGGAVVGGDVHERVRAWGSLAAEVADAGVPGVVAMRYNVYVVTAAQFVADLYAHLLAGRTLGQAATAARKALAADPERLVGAAPVSLQDWAVPAVYEAAPLRLLAADRQAPTFQIELGRTGLGSAGAAVGLPRPPDVGFFGRDETLLALDRAFDNHRIVLLHAYAGAGKSTTAAEFARWYQATGGLDDPRLGAGPVVWTSFEYHTPLTRVIDTIGSTFANQLEAAGVHWAALTDDDQRRDIVLQVLAQVPVLWVWDNIEPVTGFPAGTRSAWTTVEQQELAGFLRDLAATTRCRVLLTSRRDEQAWLGDLPARVRLPGMPMRERLQLTHALAERHTGSVAGLTAVDWRPLLRYTGGNPLTITVAVGQALRERVATTDQLRQSLDRIQSGQTPLEAADDEALGRDRSLAASLGYGFTTAFNDTERAQLAVLHLFRDTVNVEALRSMGDSDVAGADAVPALAELTREDGINLLDRAAEIGLLTAYNNGYYGIHPALPWYFTALFTDHHGTTTTTAAAAVERAYARALGDVGRYYVQLVFEGHAANVVPTLAAEEANLLYVLDIARTQHLPAAALNCLEGLFHLYDLTGRAIEWVRLLNEVTPDYVDPATDQPRPGREDQYSMITDYRVRIARAARDWPTAIRHQTALVDWDRARAAAALTTPPGQLDGDSRNHIRNLAASLQLLGAILADQANPGCLDHYHEAFDLCQRIDARTEAAAVALSIGNVYMDVPGMRDLDRAEQWYRRSLDLTPQHDRLGQAGSHGQLAAVASERFDDARAAGAPEQTLLEHLNTALSGYRTALDLTPPDHHEYQAVGHNALGRIYHRVRDTANALRHYQQSLKHEEMRGNFYGAGRKRYNIAVLLAENGRTTDALDYAHAALANFQAVGPGAAAETGIARSLITDLQQATTPGPAPG
jgi:tetratricopeptide (TPR) repeat protein